MPGGDAELSATLPERLWDRLRGWSPLQPILVTPVVTLPLSALLIFTVGGEVDASALGLVEVEWTRDAGRLDRTHYFYFDFWVTWLLLTAPGVVNLLVARWLFHELTYVRLAAGISLVLALLRTFVVPLASILWLSASVIGDAGLLIRVPINEGGSTSDPSAVLATLRLLTTAWTGGLGMWLVTLAVWQAYEPLMARFLPRVKPPLERRPGEPTNWSGFLRRR